MLTVFRLAFAALCLAKAVDVAYRGGSAIGTLPSLGIGALWAAAAVCLALGYRVKLAAGTIIALAAAVALLSNMALYNQHLYLIASICAVFIIGQQMPTLLKAQLSIAYAFAAVTKLNEVFLSGTIVYISAIQRPVWETLVGVDPEAWMLIAVSIAAVATEAFLAVGFWFRRTRWIALVVGVGFHLGMLVLMTADLPSLLRLSIFGFLMMILYIPFFPHEVEAGRQKLVDRSVRPARHLAATR